MDPPGFALRRPNIPRARRVVTAPAAPSTSPQPSQSSAPASPPNGAVSNSEEIVETLYNHPCVKIITFTSSRFGAATFLPSPSTNDAPPGSLPASSRLERTIAVGAFRIYRAPGSVAFLSCGSALQPIFPRSQCWCINEDNSRFVLQIRRPQYWRIELPVADPDDAERAVLLRDVLVKVLQFEKTECPFERGFTVSLPDPPTTPVKKKAWTAEGKNLITNRFDTELSPPAQTPKVISRGERAASVSTREFPLPNIEALVGYKLRNNSILEAEDESSGSPVSNDSNPREHEDNATAGIDSVSSPLPSGGANDDSIDVLEQITAALPTLWENTTQKPTATSESTQPAGGSEPIRDPESQIPDSVSSGVKVILHQESHSSSTEQCQPASPTARPSIDAQPSGLDRPKDSEPVGIYFSTIHYRPEMEAQSYQTTQSPLASSDNSTASPFMGIPEIHQEYYESSSQKDDLYSESDQLSEDDGPSSFEGSGRVAPVNLTRKRMTRVLAGRSYTPPRLDRLATSPTKYAARIAPPSQLPRALVEGLSPSASTDSFHSVQSWHVPPTESPPSPSSSRPDTPHIEDLSPSVHQVTSQELPSDHTATPVSDNCAVSAPAPSDISNSRESPVRFAPTAVGKFPKETVNADDGPRPSLLSAFEQKVPPRRRSHASNFPTGRRSLSPLPPPANIYTPPSGQTSRGPLGVVSRLPSVFVNKTMEILLNPPGHLVNLMLKVAAKIAAGEWRGLVFGFGEAGEQIPVQWDYYSDGDFSDLSDTDGYDIDEDMSTRRGSVQRRTTWTDDDYRNVCEVD